jgi:anti-sigma factor RsiW
MDCKESGGLLDAYLDGELAGGQRLEVERHLACCPACRSHAREADAFRAFFRAGAPRYRAPEQLRASVVAALRPERTLPGPGRKFWRAASLYAAAVLVVSLCLYLSLSLTIFLPDGDKPWCDAAVLDHARSVAANHLVDVASGDHQLVKSWLGARLPFSPPVFDLPVSGYHLIGGRVGILEKQPVAVVVYRREKEVVSLFCWPLGDGTVMDRDRQTGGYRVDAWSNAQCNYILVSKLTEDDHDALLDAVRDRLPLGTY